jgi:hypothetical protein
VIDLKPDHRARAPGCHALAVSTTLMAGAAFLTPLWAAEPDRPSCLLLICAVELRGFFERRGVAAEMAKWSPGRVTVSGRRPRSQKPMAS